MARSCPYPTASARSSNPVRRTRELGERLAAEGYRAYLVGGTVRDAFLDRDLSDLDVDVDIATDARPDEIERIVRGWADHVWLQGQRFGTVGCSQRRTQLRAHDVPGRRVPPREP